MSRIVPKVLQQARSRRRVTQGQIARTLGVTQQRVAAIESPDGALVTAPTIEAYARALKTTPAEMLAEHDLWAPPAAERHGDPPRETFAPPGPEREEQLRRLLRVCDGNGAQVARVLGVSPQRIRQLRGKGGWGDRGER